MTTREDILEPRTMSVGDVVTFGGSTAQLVVRIDGMNVIFVMLHDDSEDYPPGTVFKVEMPYALYGTRVYRRLSAIGAPSSPKFSRDARSLDREGSAT